MTLLQFEMQFDHSSHRGGASCRMFGDIGHLPYSKSTFSGHLMSIIIGILHSTLSLVG